MTVTERERRRMELVDGSAHRTELCEQLAMREYELENLKEENAKLRELARDMWDGYNDPRCEECHLKDTPTCADCHICAREASVLDRMRELGIEVG